MITGTTTPPHTIQVSSCGPSLSSTPLARRRPRRIAQITKPATTAYTPAPRPNISHQMPAIRCDSDPCVCRIDGVRLLPHAANASGAAINATKASRRRFIPDGSSTTAPVAR